MIDPPPHARTIQTTDNWITPQWLIERLGPFDLDPCACDPQPWPCAREQYTTLGLMRDWFGFVWMNPPYGLAAAHWLERLASHGSGIALVFARTDTKMFFRHVWPKASALIFVKGRITFHYPDGTLPRKGANSGGPSVLIGYGDIAADKLAGVKDLGAFIRLNSVE